MSLLNYVNRESTLTDAPQPTTPVESPIPTTDMEFKMRGGPTTEKDKEKEINETAVEAIQTTEAQFAERFYNWEQYGLVPVKEETQDPKTGISSVRYILLDPTIPEDPSVENRIARSGSKVHSRQCVGVTEVTNGYWKDKGGRWSDRIRSTDVTTVMSSPGENGVSNVVRTQRRSESVINELGQLTIIDKQGVSLGKSNVTTGGIEWVNGFVGKNERVGATRPDLRKHEVKRMSFKAFKPEGDRDTFTIIEKVLAPRPQRSFNPEDKALMDKVLDKRRQRHFTSESLSEFTGELRKRKKKMGY